MKPGKDGMNAILQAYRNMFITAGKLTIGEGSRKMLMKTHTHTHTHTHTLSHTMEFLRLHVTPKTRALRECR